MQVDVDAQVKVGLALSRHHGAQVKHGERSVATADERAAKLSVRHVTDRDFGPLLELFEEQPRRRCDIGKHQLADGSGALHAGRRVRAESASAQQRPS